MPDLIKRKTFTSYIIAKLRSTSLWTLANRVIKYVRRFMLVGRILKYISMAFTIIETSAVLILSVAVLAVLLPISLIALGALCIADLVIGGRALASRELRELLECERIYVIAQAGGFGDGMAAELSQNGAAVFVITASFSKKFISAERENGVYYIRHAFFFRLKRRYLSRLEDKLIYLI